MNAGCRKYNVGHLVKERKLAPWGNRTSKLAARLLSWGHMSVTVHSDSTVRSVTNVPEESNVVDWG